MKPKDAKNILDRIEQEGFEYTFVHYDDFIDIKDEEFHKFRTNYLMAREKFIDFLGIEDV